MKLIAGTRGSALARTQTNYVLDRLRAKRPEYELEVHIVKTEGDVRADQPLSEIGGKGAFVKELEAAIARREVDLAIHSLKDVPAVVPEEFRIAAVLARGDVRDALVSRSGETLMKLPIGAVVATGSSRRTVQIHALRPDLEIRPIRGNVDTRLRKLDAGEFDALVLAAAGLTRLGKAQRIVEYLDPEQIIPAPGQGALAIEMSASSPHLAAVAGLDDQATRIATTAERTFLATLGADCWLPVAAHAFVEGGRLKMRAMVADDAGRIARYEMTAPNHDPVALGQWVGNALIECRGITQRS